MKSDQKILKYSEVSLNRKALIWRLRNLRDTYKIDEATGQVDISAAAAVQIHDLLRYSSETYDAHFPFCPDAFHVFSDILKIKLLLDIVVAASGLTAQDLNKLDEDIGGIYIRSAVPVQNTMFYQPDILDVAVRYPQILNIIQDVYAAGEGGHILTKELITGIIMNYFGPYTPAQVVLRNDIQDIGAKFISDIIGSDVVEDQLIHLITPGVQKPLFGFNQVEAQSMSPELWHLSGLKYAVKYLLPGLLVSMIMSDILNREVLDDIFNNIAGDKHV